MKIVTCPFSCIEAVAAEHRPSHMITLLDPEQPVETPAGIEPGRHLKLGVWDISHPADGMTLASPEQVARILAFGETWDAGRPMLVHCWAGISRSTAAAYMLACARNPGRSELEIAQQLRQAAPHAHPNRRLVQLADEALDRRGRMVEAVESIGGSNFAVMGQPFELPAVF